MMDTTLVSGKLKAPTYKLEPDEVWFHFLYGNVPGHQIDFIYQPEVPQAPLTRLHVNHLTQIVKFIEPRSAMASAFAITNLSRGDSQYEPGHGGVAFVFGLRIKGARDHAGRQDPPFCHAAAVIDRHLDADTIYGISAQFYQKLLPDEESQTEGSGWYHSYVKYAESPNAVIPLLRGYVQDFSGVLYAPAPSRLTLRWTIECARGEKAKTPRRVVVVYPDKTDFQTLAFYMSKMAAVLIESDLKWTAISNGREQDLTGGMAVRFVPRREADNDAAEDVVLMYMEQIPENPADIARLFGMSPARMSQLPELRTNAPLPIPAPVEEQSISGAHALNSAIRSQPAMPAVDTVGLARTVAKEDSGEPILPRRDLVKELKKKERKQSTALLAFGALFVLVLIAVWLLWDQLSPRSPADLMDAAAPKAPTTISAKAAVPTIINEAPLILNPPAVPSVTATAAPTSTPTTTAKKPSGPATKKTTKTKQAPIDPWKL